MQNGIGPPKHKVPEVGVQLDNKNACRADSPGPNKTF